MSDVCILTNGVLITGGPASRVIPEGAVAWAGSRVLSVGEEANLAAEHPGARILDAGGGLILPGLINVHHHLYSALARGLDPGAPMKDFPEILDRLWWRLDRALDPGSIRLSASLSAADCIRWGCTTVFDHHASPTSISGSLDLIAEAVEEAGLSAVLCYEITDRNGPEGAMEGIEENLRFMAQRKDHPRVRGTVGLHASFTLRDETLDLVSRRRPKGVGCHIHVAEHPLDAEFSLETFGAGPIQRLQRAGLLDERALLAHGIHLGVEDYQSVAEAGATILHNPESNANNGVGRLDVPGVAALGCRLGLGTDGMSAAMLRALRFAFLALRGEEKDPTVGFQALPSLLMENVRVARHHFDEPLLGELAPGAPADMIAVDSSPPTPFSRENFFAHLVYGASEAPVRHTVARGQVLLKDFKHTTLDPTELARQAREVAPEVWKRFHALDLNTPFLGPKTQDRA